MLKVKEMGDMGLMGLMGCVLMAAILTGCFTSWVVILLRKWGVLEWLQVHGSEFVGKLVSCDYCLNWWLSWAVVVIALAATGEWWMVAVPFFSTTVGRWLSA